MGRASLALAVGACLAGCGGKAPESPSRVPQDFMEVRGDGAAVARLLEAGFGIPVRARDGTTYIRYGDADVGRREPAEDVLDLLGRDRNPQAAATLEIWDAPLCTSQNPRVFGLGEAKTRTAVASIADLGPADAPSFLPRLARVALHETAHALGLLHCDDAECLMHPADSVEQLDRTALAPCERCFGSFCRARGENLAARRSALEAAARVAGISVGPLARPASGSPGGAR
ncbi:MAG: matrixin family metalloprotease [Planctomycetales bacterium]|nr:matrixin family metalloprotease [Planctomycetales bacterium]